MRRQGWIASSVLLLSVVVAGAGLAAWKHAELFGADHQAAGPEPAESIAIAAARPIQHRDRSTAIGTVLALRSVTLRNELEGVVSQVNLTPGQIVEAGTLLVALDVSVEEAELRAHEAQAALAETLLRRVLQMSRGSAASDTEVDRARAERDIALAQVARVKAIIARKTIRAPFRARVGIADVHPGQYLQAGTMLTTLQGVDEAVHVDFTVAQRVAAGLRAGDTVEIVQPARGGEPLTARIIALDARIDPHTRNAVVRARVSGDPDAAQLVPGASVRVRVPVGTPIDAVAVPVNALRKGPSGEHVFVITPDEQGQPRAHERRVRSGAVVGDAVLILDGLAAGEQVAASGSFKLRESVLVAAAAPGPSIAAQ